jgi:AraC-like DNA-binding protein
MTIHRSALATLSQAAYSYLESQDLDAQALFHRAGMDASRIYAADARFPVYAINRLWQIAIHETKNPCLAYEIAPLIEPRMLHAMGHAWIVSRTLIEALQRLVRYHHMLSTNADIKLESAQGTWLFMASHHESPGEDFTDGLLAFSLHMCRQAYGDDLTPLQVQLIRAQPIDASPIENFYRCQVEYNCPENVITFSSTDLNRKLLGANPAIAVAMEDVINTYLARIDANDIVSRVRKIVAATLVHGEPTREDIADEINISARTLQRRLEDQESSVKKIVDETRHQLALDFLSQDHYSIKEIAYNLGFSDPSNFSRAFKRWEGMTPREFRS